jgi:beta-glucosidase-like glycosyl hydrolase
MTSKAKFKILTLITILLVTGCTPKRYDREAALVTSAIDLDRKVGQMIIVAVPGSSMNNAIKAILKSYVPGGVILFGYNLASLESNKKFIGEMQEYSQQSSGIPLFVSIDQEGGRVVRITSGVTQFPGNMAAGIGRDCSLTYLWGRILGLELRRCGINMNLSPVLDVNNNPFNPVINTRSFGSDPRVVASLGTCYIRGLQESGCMAVGKHFPGHGDTNLDSHSTLPVILSNMRRLEKIELYPFTEAISSSVEGIMTAHISYPKILGNNDPATISPYFLTRLLRNDLKFKGLVITDDMEMAAISQRLELGEAAVQSILAGADIVLISSYGRNIQLVVSAIRHAVSAGRISQERLNESVCRILEAKMRYGIMAYEHGRVRRVYSPLTGKEEKILSDAGRVNSELSRKGTFYFGDISLLNPGRNATRIFITSNTMLRQVLDKNEANIICGINELARFTARKGTKIIIYLHVVEPDLHRIQAVARFCEKRGFALVLISSGNPYPITVSGIVRAGLLSFSDTDESIRQIGICLNGGFYPTIDSSLFQGIKK